MRYDQLPPTPPRLQRDKRYGWLRLYNDFARHPKWRVVSSMTGIPVSQVVAIAAAMLCHANMARPRGSLAEFNVLECGAALDIPSDSAARVYATLEELEWIEQDFITTWFERQPDQEDPTAAERQRRRRQKRKAERVANCPQEASRVTPVTHRDVTLEQTEKRKKEGNASTLSSDVLAESAQGLVNKEVGETQENQAKAELWVMSEGVKITMARCACPKSIAELKIVRWRNEASKNFLVLAQTLAKADTEGIIGDKFQRLVSSEIERYMRETRFGLPLPFGPTIVKRGQE